jgi:hypothetical protein
MYLASIAKTHDLIKNDQVPQEFWGDGLKFIAENSESSFRKALQMLQQCYEGKIFDIKVIKETFDIVSYDDAAAMLADISHGNVTKNVWDSIMGNDYQEKFGLISKIIGDAAAVKAFGLKYVDETEKWKWKNPLAIAEGKNFTKLSDAILRLGKTAYLRRGDWEIEMSNLITPSEGVNIVKRRPIKPI